jgi:O-antigen/teichoic acid export membrane protein
MGALMSYFAIAFNMVSGLLYTPWMIDQIGQGNYGLYTLSNSLITLFIMDFGMSAAVSRFVSKYRAEGNQEAVNNFLGIIYKLYIALDGVILTALVCVSFFINTIYDNLTANELETFKVLYVIVGLFSVISFPFTNLNGILTAYENFIGMKLADLFHKVFIVVAMVIALLMGYGVYALVTVNAISGILTILVKLYIIRKKTNVRVNFKCKDKTILKDVLGFSMWTTLTSLARRMIFNISPSIIVAVSSTGAIGSAIFGLATTVEGYISTFAAAINGMFMPRISKIVHEGKKDTELTDLMIKIGRIQCIIIGALVVGFVSFGESFIIDIWRKPDFIESYLCAVLLIIPSYFYMPLQIANTTLVVENKVKLQSIIYIITGVVNVGLSLIMSRYMGALGASISICIAYLLRSILLVIAHYKVLHLNMKRFFKESYLKITPFLLLSMGIGLCLEHFNPMSSGLLRFVINGGAFVVIFAVIMVLFVMNKSEKNLIFGTMKKVLRKFKIIK